MIKGFLFDLDGTIWDSKQIILECLKKTIQHSTNKVVSMGELKKDFDNYGSHTKILKNYGVFSLNQYWSVYKHNYNKINLFFGNTNSILNRLIENNKTVGFVTSLKKEFALMLLEKFNLYKYQKVLVTPSDCRSTKPSTAPLKLALKILSLDNKEVIYIGDQDSDIIAAKATGCLSGLAKWGTNPITQKSDYYLEKFDDILKLI